MFNNFLLKNRAVCEIMWKNMVEPTVHRWQWNMALDIACWVPKVTNTHS